MSELIPNKKSASRSSYVEAHRSSWRVEGVEGEEEKEEEEEEKEEEYEQVLTLMLIVAEGWRN